MVDYPEDVVVEEVFHCLLRGFRALLNQVEFDHVLWSPQGEVLEPIAATAATAAKEVRKMEKGKGDREECQGKQPQRPGSDGKGEHLECAVGQEEWDQFECGHQFFFKGHGLPREEEVGNGRLGDHHHRAGQRGDLPPFWGTVGC